MAVPSLCATPTHATSGVLLRRGREVLVRTVFITVDTACELGWFGDVSREVGVTVEDEDDAGDGKSNAEVTLALPSPKATRRMGITTEVGILSPQGQVWATRVSSSSRDRPGSNARR